MTTNKEDYIKEIYHLGGARRNISNKELAQRLHVSPASVSEMLVKLRREGYILYEPYAGSSLTPAGIAAAAPRSFWSTRPHRDSKSGSRRF